MLRRVQRGEFMPPRQVKRAVPTPLEAICLKAMALRPKDRYNSPRALADDIEHWLADEPVSAWREPLPLRTRRWMRRHRTLTTSTLAAALVAGALVGLGWAWNRSQRLRNESAAQAALSDADRLGVQARATSDLAVWGKAIAAARRAQALLESSGGSPALVRKVDATLASLQAQERDRKMLDDLEEAALLATMPSQGDQREMFDVAAKLKAYEKAFRDYGLDVDALDGSELSARIQRSPIRAPLVSALEDWLLTWGQDPRPTETGGAPIPVPDGHRPERDRRPSPGCPRRLRARRPGNVTEPGEPARSFNTFEGRPLRPRFHLPQTQGFRTGSEALEAGPGALSG
ncbi:MAG: hypothetical protein ACHRXM_10480 [Isosphaerales bacterium]